MENFSYAAILGRILDNYEQLAEGNGQDGDTEIYTYQINVVTGFREGLKKFKENYKVRNAKEMQFLPDFFRIMQNEYGCDTQSMKDFALNAYIYAVEKKKEQLEQELHYLDVFKEALEKVQ